MNLDFDEHGWPKKPIDQEGPSQESIDYQNRRKQEVLQKHAVKEEKIPIPKAGAKFSEAHKSHMTKEQFDEYEYPKVPENWTPEYFNKLFEKERVDPRVNPNLLLDTSSQEFWNNAARKPYAKAMLKSEQHWTDRRNVWLRQYETVETMNIMREEVAEAIEDCSNEVKRLVAPVMQYKICEVTLWNFMREAKSLNMPLHKLLEHPEKFEMLKGLRKSIDTGGPDAPERMMVEYEKKAQAVIEKNMKKLEQDQKKRIVMDTDTLTKALNMGTKCKTDGMLEWAEGNHAAALESWKQADAHLKRYKAPDTDKAGNKMIADLHSAILKNCAQAAIKLDQFTEALEFADDALVIDDQDHKAWFRKACALEGLGRLDEELEALEKVEEIAIGRPDQQRINKDVACKREKIQALHERDAAVQKKSFERALRKGIFGEEREKPLMDQPRYRNLPEEKALPEAPVQKDDAKRMKLTRDAAADLLEELRHVYGDTLFQNQVRKLGRDVRGIRDEFLKHLRKVALSVQRPLLAKWGFEDSYKGVKEMELAVKDHTEGDKADRLLVEKSEEVRRLLYGEMWDIVHMINPYAEAEEEEDQKGEAEEESSGEETESSSAVSMEVVDFEDDGVVKEAEEEVAKRAAPKKKTQSSSSTS